MFNIALGVGTPMSFAVGFREGSDSVAESQTNNNKINCLTERLWKYLNVL